MPKRKNRLVPMEGKFSVQVRYLNVLPRKEPLTVQAIVDTGADINTLLQKDIDALGLIEVGRVRLGAGGECHEAPAYGPLIEIKGRRTAHMVAAWPVRVVAADTLDILGFIVDPREEQLVPAYESLDVDTSTLGLTVEFPMPGETHKALLGSRIWPSPSLRPSR